MDRTDRIVRLHQLLSENRYGLTLEQLSAELGVSAITVRRDLIFLRDTLGAPLVLEGNADDVAPRWRYVAQAGNGPFHLPGVWLDAEELYALLMALQLTQRGRGTSSAGPTSVLGQALGPLESRLERLFGDKLKRLDRLVVLRTQARRANQTTFRFVTQAVLEGKQLSFGYRARSSGKEAEWQVHPQRLIHHRNNWYVDAVAPRRGHKMFRFAVDAMRRPQLSDEPSNDLPLDQLDAGQSPGYGIFYGPAKHHAILRFSQHAAQWIADEEWHPQQQQRPLLDGCLELIVPYANSRELLMDVMRHGAEVEVIGPPELREQMREMVLATAARYGATFAGDAGTPGTEAAAPTPSAPTKARGRKRQP
jgi:predicted DNA-binding transcriptional regulator YafY